MLIPSICFWKYYELQEMYLAVGNWGELSTVEDAHNEYIFLKTLNLTSLFQFFLTFSGLCYFWKYAD